MDQAIIEEMQQQHLKEILDIYNYYVLNSTVTFHTNTLTPEEMKELLFFTDLRYRSFVIKDNKVICGYVILTKHHIREAYNSTADVTVYLKHDYEAKGLGSHAVQFVENFAKQQGFHTLIAKICGENNKSIKLFERNGYVKCAHYKEVGTKFGRLLDVVSYQKIIS